MHTTCFKPLFGAVVLLSAVLPAACLHDDDTAPTQLTTVATPKDKLQLRRITDCAGFRRYYAESLVQQVLTDYFPCWGCEFRIQPAFAVADAEDSQASGAAHGESVNPFVVSATNVQEAGVDEADLIKSDAQGNFYIVRDRELIVVRAVPAEQMQILARLPLDIGEYRGSTRGLYLDEALHRLAILVDYTGPHYPAAAPFPEKFGTGVVFVDVSDPAAPQVSGWHWTEGYSVDSRRVDQRLHLVNSSYFGFPPSLTRDEDFHHLLNRYYQARQDRRERAADELAGLIGNRIRGAVAAAALVDLLPGQRAGLGDGPVTPLACEAVQHMDLTQRLGLMLITSIGTDGTDPRTLATVNYARQLYASRENLYLIQDSGGWWFRPEQTQQTAIYRFALSGGSAQPAGFGVVDGWINNSYSLSEHAGVLRVATTERRFVSEERPWRMTNHLFVLGDAADGNLEAVGEVRDFMRDERIFSARFLGDRGFVVTFRQIDPLFAFDLSDPRAPVVRGQVEIPGVSTYLHPLDDNHLLTVGRDGDENGLTPNIRLQIFDVSDLTQPRLAHAYVPPLPPDSYGFSLAGSDPHAFTYFSPAKVLSIPVQVGSGEPENAFSGFFAFTVDAASGFTELGRVDHKLAESDSGGSGCPAPPEDGGTVACESFAPVRYDWPLRSVVSQEAGRTVLYTLSHAALKAGDTADLSSELGSLSLEP